MKFEASTQMGSLLLGVDFPAGQSEVPECLDPGLLLVRILTSVHDLAIRPANIN